MQKLLTWAKSHKIAAGAIGCGGLIVLGFVLLLIAGLIMTAVGYEPEEVEETEVAATTQAPPPETTTPEPEPEPTTAEPEPSPTPEAEETTEAPEPPANPEDALAEELSNLDGLDIANADGALLVTFDANPNFDNLDHQTTLDIINATHEVYDAEYRYLMVTGREPAGTWAFSYDKPTVEAIAEGTPIVSDIWELADRSFDPR